MGFIERIGTALVAPRRALSEVGDKGGLNDAALLLLLAFLATELRAIVAAAWMALVMGPGVAGSALLTRLSSAIGVELVLVFGGGVVITLFAGKRRSPLRDFDLAGVALVPYLAVELAGSLWATLLGPSMGQAFSSLLSLIALGAFAAMVVLAVIETRRPPVGAAS